MKRGPGSLLPVVTIVAAIAVVALGAGGLWWLLGGSVWIYAAVAALLLFVVYALRNLPLPLRRHGPGQIAQATNHRLEGSGKLNPRDPVRREGVVKVGRNDPCPCGSGEKYKRCCGLGSG